MKNHLVEMYRPPSYSSRKFYHFISCIFIFASAYTQLTAGSNHRIKSADFKIEGHQKVLLLIHWTSCRHVFIALH